MTISPRSLAACLINLAVMPLLVLLDQAIPDEEDET